MKKKKSIQSAGGRARAAVLSPEERSAISKKAAAFRWSKPENRAPRPPRPPKCAICHHAHASHEKETRACPAINGEGFDLLDRYISPHLVPKTKPALVRAWAGALETIADMQGEKMAPKKFRNFATDPPALGIFVLVRWPTPRGEDKFGTEIGRTDKRGRHLFVGCLNIASPEITQWFEIPDPDA